MPAKKSRPTVIELNGTSAQLTLRFLVITMPAWLNLFLVAMTAQTTEVWFLSFTAFFAFCSSFTLFLWDRKLKFKSDRLIFPSLANREIKYANIKALTAKQSKGISSLVFEIENKGQSAQHEISLDGISSRFAELLWAQISTKMRSTVVEPTVRTWLKELAEGNALEKATVNTAIERRFTPPELTKTTETSMEIDLNAHSWFGELYSYIASYDKSFYRTFATFWLLVGAIQLIGNVIHFIPTKYLLQGFGGLDVVIPSLNSLYYSIDYWFRVLGDPLIHALTFLSFNIYAATGFLLLALTGLFYTIANWATPDTVLINENGVTEQINTPNGAIAKKHLAWSSIESIDIVQARRPFKLVAEPTLVLTAAGLKNKAARTIKLPVSTLATAHKGSIFLNIVGNCAPQAKVPQLLTEQLSRESTTYTDIWLNSIEEAPQLSTLTPLMSGQTLESKNLMIMEQIGSGGQAVTYLARQSDTAEAPPVVLKEIILPVYIESAKQKAITRFNRDAQLLKELEHTGIVKLYDYFIDNNRAFLMLEYVEGTTLRNKILENGPLEERAVLELARQMVDILDYLHTRTPPVMHRDFTPENLLINQSGQLKLIDFDVAFRSDESGNKATVVGKQNFLPPEQFRGHPCPQSDIYALGATLHYLLTGEEPLALSQSQPQEKNKACSKTLNDFVAKCTELDLNNRFASADEMKATLPEKTAAEK